MKDHRADLQPFTGLRRTRLQQLLALSEEGDVKTLGSSANGRHQEFEAELQHRTRNLLATVQAIASRTLGASDEAAAFGARLAALGRVQGLKSSAEGEIDLAELIGQEMKAHGIADGRVTFEGEPVGFPRAKTELLALAVHELTTNARKHGALASRGGALSIRWWTYGLSGHRRLTLRWAEARDQSCRAVGQGRGFGRELLERALPYSLDATTELEIGPGGVHCQIDIPLPESRKDLSCRRRRFRHRTWISQPPQDGSGEMKAAEESRSEPVVAGGEAILPSRSTERLNHVRAAV